MLVLLLACLPKGHPVRLDPEASVRVLSPSGESPSYTLDISVAGEGVEGVEIAADGRRVGEVEPGGTLRWRSPAAGPVRIEARGLRGDVVVAVDAVTVEAGLGLSREVEAWIARYPTDGSYGFHWPPDDGVWWGTPHELRYGDTVLSPADPLARSHCVGLTWEVAVSVLAAEGGGTINGLGVDELHALRADWFVREILGAGAADAVVAWGVGERVDEDDLRPGDFLQFWSTGRGGHSAVFLGWVLRGHKRVGVTYWSTHPATNGIGVRTEYFGGLGIDRKYFFGARLWAAEDWR